MIETQNGEGKKSARKLRDYFMVMVTILINALNYKVDYLLLLFFGKKKISQKGGCAHSFLLSLVIIRK